MSKSIQKKINKILIVQTAFVGDVVLITSLIRETKNLFPSSVLDVMVIPQTAPLLENNPHIRKVLIFSKQSHLNFFQIVKCIKSEKYDLAITPHSSTRTALILYFSEIPNRIGYNRWFSRHFLTLKVPHLKNTHKINKLLHLLSPFTPNKLSMETELFPSLQDKEQAEKILQVFTEEQSKILIAPGSVWTTKCWKAEYYAELLEQLLKYDYQVILSGSKKEKELCESIVKRISNIYNKNLINICGQTTLLETAEIISRCQLVICNDSGTLHIANAMKTRVYAFFGPTVQSIGYYPYRENDFVFEIDLPCRPCGSHGSQQCPLKHHRCMTDIKPSIVLEKVLETIPIKREV